MNIRILFPILVVSILTCTAVTPVVHSSTPEDADDWSMFGHDPTRQRYSTSSAPDDNNVRWSYDTDSDVTTSPAIADGYAIVACVEGKVIAFNATTGTKLWTTITEIGQNVVRSSPAIDSGRVYVGTINHKFYCFNQSTGELLWTFTAGNRIDSSPVVKDGRVVFSSDDGKCYCLNAINGSLVWEHVLHELSIDSESSPAIGDDVIVVGARRNVTALNATTGDEIWTYLTTSEYSARASAAISGERTYFASDKMMYCLNTSTGSLIWNTSILNQRSSPAVANDRVFIGSTNGSIYSFNATTGAVIWQYPVGQPIQSSPAVADGKVFVGSDDGSIYCMNETTGELIWSQYLMGRVISSPAIAGGAVFIGCGVSLMEGRVYAFGPDETVPTTTTLNLDTTTAYLGFKVTFSGQLEVNGTAMHGALVVLAYSVDGGQNWVDITSDVTSDGGLFSAEWTPYATGMFRVRASFAANYPLRGSESVKMLSVLPFADQCIFSVSSNSTLSELAFDYTSSNLSFTVTGEAGTTGYVEVTIAEDLVVDINDLKVYLDGSNMNYTVASTETSWIINCVYTHSTHNIVVNLGELNYIPEIGFLSIAFLVAASLLGSLIYYRHKKKT